MVVLNNCIEVINYNHKNKVVDFDEHPSIVN